jgi:hypothetical protein
MGFQANVEMGFELRVTGKDRSSADLFNESLFFQLLEVPMKSNRGDAQAPGIRMNRDLTFLTQLV